LVNSSSLADHLTDFNIKGDSDMKKVFSFDAETNGLWGQVFAMGALVYDYKGKEIARFVGRLSDSEVTDEWVRKKCPSEAFRHPRDA